MVMGTFWELKELEREVLKMDAVKEILLWVVPIVGSYLGLLLINTLRKKAAESRLAEVGLTAVHYAHQLWTSGQIQKSDRYDKAMEYLAGKFKMVSKDELKTVIEATVSKVDVDAGSSTLNK
jgi:hypothetical protein